MTSMVTVRTSPESSAATVIFPSGNYEGVAPDVNLIDLRALDLNGAGSDSTVIAAIQQAIALKSTYNIRVINLSLGRGISVSYAQDPLCQAVESAWKTGIVVVVAAGNYGRVSIDGSNGFGTVTAPGNDPFVADGGRHEESMDPLRSQPKPWRATARRAPPLMITW